MFIVFEGTDGSGKTTQVRLLAQYLENLGHKVFVTREPGGSPNSEELRALLLHSDNDWDIYAELFIVLAARLDHVNKVIKPKLAAGEIVICDRFILSTLAYQGYGRGVPLSTIWDLHQQFLTDFWPDFTFILDTDLSTSRQRISKNKDRIERMDEAFFNRVLNGFRELGSCKNTFLLPPQRIAEIKNKIKKIINI